ncbi:MAG: PorP/SprF family type IX secretion system membrane protein [Bacteroidota bacterium]
MSAFALVPVLEAQQLPVFSRYLYEQTWLNPAATGSMVTHQFAGHFRRQWIGLPDAPSAQWLGYQGRPLAGRAIGLGAMLHRDRAHIFGRTGLMVQAAYHLGSPVKGHQFSTGIMLGAYSQGVAWNNELLVGSPDDPLLVNDPFRTVRLDAGLGVNYQYSSDAFSLRMGLAAQQLPAAYEVTGGLDFTQYAHWTLTGQAVFQATPQVKVVPSVLYRLLPGDSVSLQAGALEVGLRTQFEEAGLWVAIGTRTQGGGFHLGLGLQLGSDKPLDMMAVYDTHSQLGSSLEMGLAYTVNPTIPSSGNAREPYWESSPQLQSRLEGAKTGLAEAKAVSASGKGFTELTYGYGEESDEYALGKLSSLNKLVRHIVETVQDMQDKKQRPHAGDILQITLESDLMEDEAALSELSFSSYKGEYGRALSESFVLDGGVQIENIGKSRLTKLQLAYVKLLAVQRALSKELNLSSNKFSIVLFSESAKDFQRESRIVIRFAE